MRRDNNWNHFHYTYGDGRQATVHFDVGCAFAAPPTYPHNVRVLVRGENDLEARLSALLEGVDCWLVGILRYHETTAFVFQVEDLAAFSLAEAKLHQVATIELQRSDGWGFFDERVCPTEVDWQRISDRELCEQHALAGLDLECVRDVAHGFYGDSGALERVRSRLLEEGLTVHAHQAQRLVMVRRHALCAISDVSVPLARFARSQGVAYDGWKPAHLW